MIYIHVIWSTISIFHIKTVLQQTYIKFLKGTILAYYDPEVLSTGVTPIYLKCLKFANPNTFILVILSIAAYVVQPVFTLSPLQVGVTG